MGLDLQDLITALLSKLRVVNGPDPSGNYTCWCCFHPDGEGEPPHRPNLYISEKGFICHACGEKGNLRKLASFLGIRPDLGEPERIYDYVDEKGKPLFQVVRYPGKRFRQRRPDGLGGWVWNLQGMRRVLYRLPELLQRKDESVFLVEGEKDVESLLGRGLLATTNPCGAGKWRPEYSQILSGRDVVILPDNDEPGRNHAHQVANSLLGRANSVKVIELPGLGEKGDVSDWLATGHTTEELIELADGAEPITAPIEISQNDTPLAPSILKESQADHLVQMFLESDTVLFMDQHQEGFARIQTDDHNEICPVNSKAFKLFVSRRFYEQYRKVPGYDAIRNALNLIDAECRYGGIRHHLYNRVARNEKELWYDLSDEKWRAVRITEEGWQVVSTPPILFRRYTHQIPQVSPAAEGHINDIFEFINIESQRDRLLFLSFLLSCFIPEIPHPICMLYGPHGAAKTSAFAFLKQLIDPSEVDIMAFPKEELSLVQTVSHHWATFFDNVSSLQDWGSDALCRIVTGEGLSKRKLYSDDEDFIYSFRGCLGVNGINVVARKPDLLDRALLIGLDLIRDNRRKEETVLREQYDLAKPRLLGSIFEVLSKAMRCRHDVKMESTPRMADFAIWGRAFARAMGCSDADFIAAYSENIDLQTEEVVQGNPVASLIAELVEGKASWDGTVSELLTELNRLAAEKNVDTNSKYWPKAAHSLSRRINELIPGLSASGITVKQSRMRKGARIRITRRIEECEMPV